jgi:hypothetical protein
MKKNLPYCKHHPNVRMKLSIEPIPFRDKGNPNLNRQVLRCPVVDKSTKLQCPWMELVLDSERIETAFCKTCKKPLTLEDHHRSECGTCRYARQKKSIGLHARYLTKLARKRVAA